MARSTSATPTEPPDLAGLLGSAWPAWAALRAFLDELPGVTSAWKFYGAKHGWQLKVTANRRALIYLIPRAGRFTAALALRAPAIAALRAGKAPPARLREIEQAKEAPEGRPARVEVTRLGDLAWVEQLVSAKLATA